VTNYFIGLATLFIFLLGCGSPPTVTEAVVVPLPQAIEITPDTVVTQVPEQAAFYSRGIKKIADKSRQAAVQIHDHVRGVRGTGTYYRFEDYFIVLTAAHVVDGGSQIVEIRTPSGESTAGLILMLDNRISSDFAVLLVKDRLATRKPMDLKIRDVSQELVGEEVVYTGDPGHQRQMTIFGNVSGYGSDGSIIMHSFAWGGASGSSVFDDKGRLVGILKAIDVNRSQLSPFPQLTEDMVWLSPAHLIAEEDIRSLLRIYELMLSLNGEEMK
jgi:hypothetical protein